MTLQIVLIEDQDRESLAAKIRELGDGDLEVVALSPPSDLDLAEVLDANPDLFLIDYELDAQQPDDSIATYRGTTLAARIREERPEFPIVLLTRSQLYLWTSEQRTVKVGRTFDSILYKEEHLREAANATYDQLVSLARGYKVLRESEERTVSSLLDLLRTDDVGREKALEAQLPSDGWKAVEAAHRIRSVLLRYPGVVYDPAHAATALGISNNSFNQPQVLNLLERAKYRGPFDEEKPRWWRHTLFDIANELYTTTEEKLGLGEGFRSMASEKLGLELEPSSDAETGTVPADTVCYLLGIPIRIETSLPYRPDARPPVMDEARVSFKAIRETNLVDENHLDAVSRDLLEEIRQQSRGN